MLEHIHIHKILFLDIETVPLNSSYSGLAEKSQKLWNRKASLLQREKDKDKSPEELYERAGIYAEFGKIICISVGYFSNAPNAENGGLQFRTKSFYGDDEKEFLNLFAGLLNKHYNTPEHLLCAHNGKEFDFPYIARRMLINGVRLPGALDIAGKKPWEIRHLDTMELWKFGDYKSYTSLEQLAWLFNIPTPKDDIDGSEVGRVYWQEKDLDRIVKYCRKDVITIAQIFLKFRGEPVIDESQIIVT